MGRQRDHMVCFRMSEKEIRTVEKKMAQLDLRNREAYLRKMALDGYCVQIDIPEIRKMTSLLSRCSNNLNQYARKANQTGSIYQEDIQDLKIRLSQIYSVVEKILIRLNALQV